MMSTQIYKQNSYQKLGWNCKLCPYKMCVKLKGYVYHFLYPPLWFFPRWCVDQCQKVPLWFPPTSGGRGGLMRRGVKRKRRPLSRHKYHNSILNNASLLGRGLTLTHTHTQRYTRGKHKRSQIHTHTQIIVLRLPLSNNTNKLGDAVQLSALFKYIWYIIKHMEAATVGIVTGGCHLCVCFIVVFGAIESFASVCCVSVGAHAGSRGLLYVGWRLLWAFASRGSLLQRTYARNICERQPGVCSLSPNRSAAVVEKPEPQITAWGLSLAHRLVLWWLPRILYCVLLPWNTSRSFTESNCRKHK